MDVHRNVKYEARILAKEIMNSKLNRLNIVIVCGTALLIAAAVAVVVASRSCQQPAPPDVLVAAYSAEVCVKAVERNPVATVATAAPDASRAVAIICGKDPATSNRYEARNDALRSIARRRDLPEKDVAALVAYLRSKDNAMRPERVAALKNDVMNLLRNQELPPKGLTEALIAMFSGGKHPPAVLDSCIQHLGAMPGEITDDALRHRIRETFVRAARQTRQPYAGTALYSLAEAKHASQSQKNELKRLTVALCKQGSHPVARISAIQLAGERGYKEILPILRETLSSSRRDAVLDIVSIGSLGLLGNESDLKLLALISREVEAWRSFMLLAVYNLAFIAPLVVIFILAAKGADSERMSRWSKRNIFPSKLAMGIVFAILGVLVLPKFSGFIVDIIAK